MSHSKQFEVRIAELEQQQEELKKELQIIHIIQARNIKRAEHDAYIEKLRRLDLDTLSFFASEMGELRQELSTQTKKSVPIVGMKKLPGVL